MAEGERQELEKLRRLKELSARDAAHPSPATPDASAVDKFVGSAPVRMALGPPSAAMGLVQMGGKAAGLDTSRLDETLHDIEASKQRGMRHWQKDSKLPDWAKDVDLAGIAGTGLVGGAATSRIPAAASTLGKIAQSTGLGTLFGVATPTEARPDYWKEKGIQATVGAVTGGAVPALSEFKSFVWPNDTDILNRVMNYIQKITGKDRIPEVTQALKTATPELPGGKVTAAHALKDTPGGDPIRSHQGTIKTVPGGTSARFLDVEKSNAKALSDYEEKSLKEMNRLKESALKAVNDKGGVNTGDLFMKIANLPSVKNATEEESNFILKHMTSKISNRQTISSQELYAMRDKFSSRFDGELGHELRTAIDQTMEASGGKDWGAYIKTYPEMKAKMEKVQQAETDLYKTRTRLEDKGKEDQVAELPHLLSHPYIDHALNFLRLSKNSQNIVPRLQSQAADLYLNPHELASALEALVARTGMPIGETAATIAIPQAVIESRKGAKHAGAY